MASIASIASPGSALPEVLHEVYTASNPPPIRHVRELGRGGFSIVDAVEVTRGRHSGHVMARKVVRLPRLASKHRSMLRSVLEEVQIMHRIKHVHVVTVAFTYEELDAKSRAIAFGILMPTVAEQSLAEFLEEQESDLQDYRDRELESEAAQLLGQTRKRMSEWYVCLAQALAYLHQERIRHRDIKPANILIKNNAVFLTDFGLSKYFEDHLTTMTYGVTEKTQMYCAPEVAASESRGRPSDVWSLGCVFLEMTTIYAGASISEFESTRGPVGQRAYHLYPAAILSWIYELQTNHPWLRANLIPWCLFMLNPVASKRITAKTLADVTRYWRLLSLGRSGSYCSCMPSGTVDWNLVSAQAAFLWRNCSSFSITESVSWDDMESFESLQKLAAFHDQQNLEPANYFLEPPQARSVDDEDVEDASPALPPSSLSPSQDDASLPRPGQDRWAQIKENAKNGAEDLWVEHEARAQIDAADNYESNGVETIESRVARIKARVAELSGNMGEDEWPPLPAVKSSKNPIWKARSPREDT
ncbi:kinase-like protein [Lophium mytilinum]|uniref:non-specific serine/threonine protein kinase n=1 Tax=Lophium mytilinum TaxID=390894 RepID=A0A6A6QT68_9PEZI|nr:kinase-like protein [Lophium mytilinum]